MICPNCGQQIPENVAFCRNCGAKTGINAAPAAAPVMQQPGQPVQAAQPVPAPAPVVRSGAEIGVPGAGTISGSILNLLGPDRVKSASLLWRILSGVGAFFILFHAFGLWFGKAIASDYMSILRLLGVSGSFHSWCDPEVFENSGYTVFTMFLLILLTLAAIGCLVMAVTKFLAVDVSETYKFMSFSFAILAVGKLFLLFWNFAIRDDIGANEDGAISVPFFLIFSLLACIGFAVLFWFLNKEFYRYRETVGPRPVFGQQAQQAPQQPYAQPQQQAPQQPPYWQDPQNPNQQ